MVRAQPDRKRPRSPAPGEQQQATPAARPSPTVAVPCSQCSLVREVQIFSAALACATKNPEAGGLRVRVFRVDRTDPYGLPKALIITMLPTMLVVTTTSLE